jgi:hypothetical protein
MPGVDAAWEQRTPSLTSEKTITNELRSPIYNPSQSLPPILQYPIMCPLDPNLPPYNRLHLNSTRSAFDYPIILVAHYEILQPQLGSIYFCDYNP